MGSRMTRGLGSHRDTSGSFQLVHVDEYNGHTISIHWCSCKNVVVHRDILQPYLVCVERSGVHRGYRKSQLPSPWLLAICEALIGHSCCDLVLRVGQSRNKARIASRLAVRLQGGYLRRSESEIRTDN